MRGDARQGTNPRTPLASSEAVQAPHLLVAGTPALRPKGIRRASSIPSSATPTLDRHVAARPNHLQSDAARPWQQQPPSAT